MKAWKTILITFALLSTALNTTNASEVVANPGNSETLNRETLKAMLIGKEKFWGSGSEVTIAILKSSPEVEQALTQYCGMTTSKFKNHWQRIVFSGRGKMPKMFNEIQDLIDYVNSNEGAIGIISSDDGADNLRLLDVSILENRYRRYARLDATAAMLTASL